MKQNIIFILFIFVGFACKKNNRTSPDAAGESFYFNAFFQQSEVWLYDENTHATLYLSLRKQESNEKINGKYFLKIIRSGIAPKLNDKTYYVTFKDGEATLQVNTADFYPYGTENQDGTFQFILQLRKENGTMEVNEQQASMRVSRYPLARLDYVQYFEEEPDVAEVYLRISPKITFAQDGKMMLAINNVLNKNLVFDKVNDSTALLALTKAQWNDLFQQDWQIYYVDALQKIPLTAKAKIYSINKKYSINRRCLHIENQRKLLELKPFPIAKNIKYNEQDKVVELDFSGKRLNTLPDEIACFSYLKNLYFFSSKLDFLPEKLGDVSTLERLDLAFQSESFTLPNSFSQLKNLVWLDMRGFPAKSLPEDFGNLTALKELNLSNAKLESLPSSIANLFQLKELYLNSNNLRDIPKEICQLSALVTLEMSQNKNIQEIPLCLTQLEQLITLKINDASIVNMPKGFAPNMKKLQYLHLNYNKLHALPDDFIKFPKLYNLYLRHNNFSEEDKIYYNNLAEDTSIGISF